MYDNIVKAALTYEEQAQNYSIFSELMKKGVKLKDLVEKAEKPTAPELFTVMEDAVRNCDTVKEACAELEKTEHCAVHRLCMQDEEYRKAREKYEEIVTKAYAASVKENEK